MIREDHELLAELARLNTDVVPLAMRVMEGSVTAQEQRIFAQRLITAGERLRHRADESERVVIDGEAVFVEDQDVPTDSDASVVLHVQS